MHECDNCGGIGGCKVGCAGPTSERIVSPEHRIAEAMVVVEEMLEQLITGPEREDVLRIKEALIGE